MADDALQGLLPRGVVTITVTRLLGLDAAPRPKAGTTMYAAITIGGHFLGRTVPFSGGEQLSLDGLFEQVLTPPDDDPIVVLAELYPVEGTAEEQATPFSELRLSIASPWSSTRTTSGGTFALEVSVVTRLVPDAQRQAVAARAIEGTTTQSTIALSDALIALIIDVEGLYRPTTGALELGARAAERKEGYTSDDDRGRVYLRHDRAGERVEVGQSVLLWARVIALGPFSPPPSVRLRFRLIDRDDPSDDWPVIRSPFRGYLDPNDHAPRGTKPFATPLGPHGGDNEGAPTASPPWEEVPGFSIVERDATTALAEATVVSKTVFESKIVFLCPSTAGDHFVLEVEPVADHAEGFVARTGLVTMWHRFDVQCYAAKDAGIPDLGRVRSIAEPACVQLDFAAEIVPIEHEGPVFTDNFNHKLRAFFHGYDRHFEEPGWFSVTFVTGIYSDGEVETKEHLLFDGTAELKKGDVPALADGDPESLAEAPVSQYIEVSLAPIPAGEKPHLRIDIKHPDRTLQFSPLGTESLAGGKTRIWLAGPGLTPEFVAGTGSIDDATSSIRWCLPTFHHRHGVVLGTGFGFHEGDAPPIKVYHDSKTDKPSGGGTAGVCGSRPVNGRRHFANFIFVVVFKNIFSDAEPIVAHELGHAFGFPHRCGYSSLTGGSCVMNYDVDWHFTDESLETLTPHPIGAWDITTYCARHAKEIRRVIPEKNPAYRWKYGGSA
ncbi:MAG: hypothetical protein U0359_29055 [Byssovorax sp.]